MSLPKKSKTPRVERVEEDYGEPAGSFKKQSQGSDDETSEREALNGKTPFVVTRMSSKVPLTFDEISSEGWTIMSSAFMDEQTMEALDGSTPFIVGTGITVDAKGDRWFTLFTDVVRVFASFGSQGEKRLKLALKMYNLENIAAWREKNPPKFVGNPPVFVKEK